MPPRPSSIAPLDPAFDDILAVAIAKPPDRRFADPDQLADALEAAAKGRVAPELRARAARLLDDHPWR